MAESEPSFEIKDEIPLAENLVAFSDTLKVLDAELATVLIPELTAIAGGKKIERDELLNALYQATKAVEGEGQ